MDKPIAIPPESVRGLQQAGSLVVLTGAGVSAESGIPTFRGQDGLWKNFRSEQLATPQAFGREPALVWDWYHWRRGIVRGAAPNAAHRAIAELEDQIPEFALITQNVDGLHQRAGSRKILELHGSLHRARCQDCSERMFLEEEEGVLNCHRCGGVMRPDVVWFGESLDLHQLEEAFRSCANADFLIVAGTSGLVQPAASLAYATLGNGGHVLEVNLEKTPFTGTASATVLGKAGEVIPELVSLAWPDGI